MWTAAALAHRALAALVFALVLGACDAVSAPPAEDAAPGSQGALGGTGGSPRDTTTTTAAGSGAMAGSGRSFMFPTSAVGADAGLPSAPSARDAGALADGDAAQPDAGCMVGATPVAACPLPASTCVSDTTLRFFENPRCEDGRCIWDSKLMRCPNGTCSGGSCATNLTLL